MVFFRLILASAIDECLYCFAMEVSLTDRERQLQQLIAGATTENEKKKHSEESASEFMLQTNDFASVGEQLYYTSHH